MLKTLLKSREPVLDEHDRLTEVDRPPGNNTFGMFAGVFTWSTPEFPQGRQVVVVANDITYKISFFRPQEDQFFYLVSQHACEFSLPHIYLSANPGARIGITKEVFNVFSCIWNNADQLDKYLYLTHDMFLKLGKKVSAIHAKEVEDEGGQRHKIMDVIRLQDGLGVLGAPVLLRERLLEHMMTL
jgi:acetyl-CoA carboxylase/biotin carboxylase 1